MMRNFSMVRRIVIKIGTNTLTRDGKLDETYIETITEEMACLSGKGYQLLLVTSGAIGMGAAELGLTGPIQDVRMRQACAAIGQPLLMYRYRETFLKHRITAAQILLTREVLNNRRSFLNLRNSVEMLLSLHAIPVFNENDNVSTAEIGNAFGDNDRLSALIASKVDADLLIMLTDIDALYDTDPRKNSAARRISVVEHITEETMMCAGGPGSLHSTGGMRTKLQAVRIAANAGCRILLAHGREPRVLRRLLAGEDMGTLFLSGEKLSSRARWIMNSEPRGTIRVDEGAMNALRRRKSLLPSGIIGLEGVFEAGEVVSINGVAKAVVGFDSSELKSLIGRHTAEITQLIGKGRRDVIARPEDIVVVEDD